MSLPGSPAEMGISVNRLCDLFIVLLRSTLENALLPRFAEPFGLSDAILTLNLLNSVLYEKNSDFCIFLVLIS